MSNKGISGSLKRAGRFLLGAPDRPRHQQWCEFFLGQLLHADRYVVLENKIKDDLLLAGEPGMDVRTCTLGSLLPRDAGLIQSFSPSWALAGASPLQAAP